METNMHRTRWASTVLAALTCALATTPRAAEEDNVGFDEGSVLIFCDAPDPDSARHAAVFAEAFPKLIENLQLRADEGMLVRAHYLGRLKDGVFLVVDGESIEEARENAAALQRQNSAIIAEAMEAAGVDLDGYAGDNCRTEEIGPVAILPMR